MTQSVLGVMLYSSIPAFGIFSIIRGSAKANRKRVLETQPERCNIFDYLCSISLDISLRLR